MTHKVLHTSIVGVVRSPRRAARNVTRTTKKNEVNKNEVNKNEVRREPTGEKVEEKSKYRKAYTLEWVATLARVARVARVAHAFLAVQVPPLAMHFMVMTLCLLWCVAVAISLFQALRAHVSLLLGRRLALVVTGGVGLDKGRDLQWDFYTKHAFFFFFFGKTRRLSQTGILWKFCGKSRNPIMTFDYVCTKRWKEGKQSS